MTSDATTTGQLPAGRELITDWPFAYGKVTTDNPWTGLLPAYCEGPGHTLCRCRADPAKAAAAMIGVVEDPVPPLRLMLGADAYALWDRRITTVQAELEAGRARGIATTLDGAKVRRSLPMPTTHD